MDAANTHTLGGGGGGAIGSGVPGGATGSSPQQFCLRWHNHQASLLSSLPVLLDQSHLTDVTLMAEGQKIKAHRVVLSACSTFFSELFRTLDGAQYPVVVLPGASYHAVAALITFMYSGEVNVYEAQIAVLLSLAETLGIKGLADFNGNPNKSTTPSTEASSSRDSDVPSPYHTMKVCSPDDSFFPRSAYPFGAPMFPQALNLATNTGTNGCPTPAHANSHQQPPSSGHASEPHPPSNGSNARSLVNHVTGGPKPSVPTCDLFGRFGHAERNELLSAEAMWKMNAELNHLAEDALAKEKQFQAHRSSTPIRLQHHHQQQQLDVTPGRSVLQEFGPAGSDGSKDCKLANGPLLLEQVKLKEEDMSDTSAQPLGQSYGSVPSTPTPQTPGLDEAGRGGHSHPPPARKSQSAAENAASSKRKKIEKIAESLRSQTGSALLPMQLFSKPPTVTPVSSTTNPYLAHHFLTNESASKTPENFSLESSHPNAASNTNTRGSPAATTPIATASSPSTPGSLHPLAPSPGTGGSASSHNEQLIKSLHIASQAQVANSLASVTQQPHQQQQQQQQQQRPPSSKLYAMCGICNKQLSNQYNLRVHLETHQNVRYACQVCSHVSRSKDALRKHVSYRHPGTPSPCDPETKRKRAKANSYSQMAKQDGALTELQQQQQQQASNLLANLTSQGGAIPLPTLLQAASLQSAIAAQQKSAALLFNQTALASVATANPSPATTAEPLGSAAKRTPASDNSGATKADDPEPKPEPVDDEPVEPVAGVQKSDKDI
ncbi:broad-complex core protein isoforms 1/2/3/4/5 [Anopheles bellator]|uniref:broad-complex core protein isoforms 1/2/3/4/5 n=1 Tax=Anopheles bellator TaxID=139047 RepID=UPI00264738FE|nr:broad-complex core protein isoforms 1/2/3/4/5 [Anopheles bellator]